MYSSATSSRSCVVMPGGWLSPSSASVSATTRPARAIVSISACDLRSIIVRGGGLEDFCTSAKTRRWALGVDTYEYASRAVVLDDRLGRLVEDLEPVPDDLRGVVGRALLEGAHVQPLDGELVGTWK
jgi:hypothetical protein